MLFPENKFNDTPCVRSEMYALGFSFQSNVITYKDNENKYQNKQYN